ETPLKTLVPRPNAGIVRIEDLPSAQPLCNFVVVGPTSSSEWKVDQATVRGETEHQYSTVRCFLTRGPSRVRMKQYYNDWWIPTVCDVSFRRPGHPITWAQDQVSTVGRDYRRQDASCGHRWGTAVEFSLEAGPMDDAAWADLWSDLEAADPQVLAVARRSTFAERTYWNRWHRTQAPWDTAEISSLQWIPPTTAAMERAAWALTADRWAPLP